MANKDKVEITQEQAEWLKEYNTSQEQIDHHIDMHGLGKRPDSPIIGWSPSKLARALYIGYEVEPKFEIGDWVFDKRDNNFFILQTTIHAGSINTYSENFRHATRQEIATEKTRRWWEKHGREAWELKLRDIIKGDGKLYIVQETVGNNITVYDLEERDLTFIPRRRFRNNISVVCFAEDRRDL